MTKAKEAPTFAAPQDYRQSNPGLHALHTAWAMEKLAEINRILHRLSQFSQVDMSILRGMIWEEHKKLILENVAYRDAAWHLLAGHKPEDVCPDVVTHDLEDE